MCEMITNGLITTCILVRLGSPVLDAGAWPHGDQATCDEREFVHRVAGVSDGPDPARVGVLSRPASPPRPAIRDHPDIAGSAIRSAR